MAGPWTINVNRNDVYVSVVASRRVMKLSLHCEEERRNPGSPWRLAYTTEHVRSGEQPRWGGPDRCAWEFQPTLWDNGLRPLVVFGVPRQALVTGHIPSGCRVVEAVDDWSTMTYVEIWQTEKGYDLPNWIEPMESPLTLQNGRRVWLGGHSEAQAAAPQIEPDNQLIVPLPQQAVLAGAPFLMVRGLVVPRFQGLSQGYEDKPPRMRPLEFTLPKIPGSSQMGV